MKMLRPNLQTKGPVLILSTNPLSPYSWLLPVSPVSLLLLLPAFLCLSLALHLSPSLPGWYSLLLLHPGQQLRSAPPLIH